MQENKTKDLALIKIQSKIWEQKRYIRELESDIEKDETAGENQYLYVYYV